MSKIQSSGENLVLNADGANNDVIIQSNGSTKVTVDGATGAVGIGTASPAKTLEVNSGSGGNVARFTSTASEASIQLVNDARTWSWGVRDISSNTNAAFIHDNGASADRLVISTAGVVSIPVGIELGSGVDGTAANTLDDYEEGTWTAGLRGGDTTGNHTYHGRNGYYTKVGRAVHIQGGIHISTIGNMAGNVYVTGLPFTVGTAGFAINFSYGGGMSITAGTVPTGYSEPSGDEFVIRHWDATSGTSQLTPSEIGSGAQIIFSGTYFI